ncbi:MAG: fibronectin type III domain-containing protein, partial [Clostridiales Family XIII bacterium]|nr:fibronectin type III domain-containing protein [Clostridiales Family XIII bacterium]
MSGILRNKNKRIITLILTLLMAFGTAVPALSPATLAADDTVTLSFTHTVNLQTAYFNALFVNGSFFEYLVNGGKTSQSIDIPKNLLHQGENTISFICGNNTTQTYYNINQAPTTRNHNDPPISNLRLDADGTVSSPTRLIKHFPTDKSIPVAQSERTENADYSDDVTYVFGDGTGGVNADINVPYMIDFVFDLDLDEPGGGHADGDGRAYLDFGSTGIQVTDSNHFKDGTYLNGEFYQYLTSDNTQQKLTLDPLRMLPGQVNVFSFVIGNGSGIYDPTVNPGAVNHDDFGVGSLTMTLPNGEIAAPGQVVLYTAVGATTPAAIEHNEITETYSSVKNYAMGDGFPAGANLSLAYRIDFLFDLTGTEWDGSYTPDVPVITLKNVSLQIGADPTRRNLVWYSNSSLAGTVQLALKSAMTGDEFPAVNAEFSAEKEASNLTGFSVNKATITGLAANTEYVYRVGNSEGRSDIYSFKTQSFDGAFSFLAAGDPQIGVRAVATDVAGWTDTLNKSFNAFPDASFLVTLGDQVQNAGSEEQYDGLFGPNVLKSIPLATVVGNHDTNPIYSQHFYMPNASATYGLSRSQDNLGDAGPYAGDYWYTYGNTLFMSLNITNLSVAEHRAFMEATIAANPDVKWKVVT